MVPSHWNSTAQIVSELGLRASGNDTEAILSELREKRAALHPDRNGGNFVNVIDESTYHSLDEAIAFVEQVHEQPSRTDIIRSDQLREIVTAAVETALVTRNTELSPHDGQFATDLRADIGNHYALRKLTSGVVGSIFLGIIAFDDKLKDDPLFGTLIHFRIVKVLLWIALVASGTMFLKVWLRERSEKLRAEELETDGALRRSFGSFCLSLRYEPKPQDSSNLKFSKLQYANSLREQADDTWEILHHWRSVIRSQKKKDKKDGEHGRIWHLMRLIPLLHRVLLPRWSISPVLSERLADIHLRRLLGRKVIAKGRDLNLDEMFEIDSRVAKQVVDDRRQYPY